MHALGPAVIVISAPHAMTGKNCQTVLGLSGHLATGCSELIAFGRVQITTKCVVNF